MRRSEKKWRWRWDDKREKKRRRQNLIQSPTYMVSNAFIWLRHLVSFCSRPASLFLSITHCFFNLFLFLFLFSDQIRSIFYSSSRRFFFFSLSSCTVDGCGVVCAWHSMACLQLNWLIREEEKRGWEEGSDTIIHQSSTSLPSTVSIVSIYSSQLVKTPWIVPGFTHRCPKPYRMDGMDLWPSSKKAWSQMVKTCSITYYCLDWDASISNALMVTVHELHIHPYTDLCILRLLLYNEIWLPSPKCAGYDEIGILLTDSTDSRH